MKKFLRRNIYFIFWGIVLLDLVAVSFHIPFLYFIAKPLLMPALITAVVLLSRRSADRKKILAALLFSFLGDSFLLFQNKDQLFFMLGLFCFLLTHIFYISYFIQIGRHGSSFAKKYPYIIPGILLYTAALLYLLMPGLGNLKIPVIVYAGVISAMLYFSLCVPFRVSKTCRRLFVAGAVCFVVSDSLLAINKFYKPFFAADVLIMLSYCLAQYFIVKGFIRNRN